MRCITPYRLKNKGDNNDVIPYITCACGKCFACLVNRRQAWLFRLYNESLTSNFTYFVTLSLDDNNCDGSLHKKDLQLFIKRLRHYLKFRYYAIGEYGTKTYRPHYHMIIFSETSLDVNLLSSMWSKGFVTMSPAKIRRLNYILHYHVRPKLPKKLDDFEFEKSFQLFSKSLGLEKIIKTVRVPIYDGKKLKFKKRYQVDSNILNMLASRNDRVITNFKGDRFVFPRYYVRKLKDLGYKIKDPDFDDCIVSQELFKEVYSDAIFDALGYPLNYDCELYFKFIHDLRSMSIRKLTKYNKQEKL